jgi:hypothetical protein
VDVSDGEVDPGSDEELLAAELALAEANAKALQLRLKLESRNKKRV